MASSLPTPDPEGGAGWRSRVRGSLALWIVNLFAATCIGTAWIEQVPSDAPWRVHLFAGAALLSTCAILSALVAAPLGLFAAALPFPRWLGAIHAVAWTVFDCLVFADTRVFRLFRYHFNGMVWNELTTSGVEDAIHLDAHVWVPLGIGALVSLLVQLLLWRRFVSRARDVRAPRLRWYARRPLWIGAVLVGALLYEKATYAWADLAREREITSLTRLYPLYQPLTLKGLAKRWGYDMAERERVPLAGGGLLLHYPLEEPRIAPAGPRPNIVMIVVDSLRSDLLDAQHLPQVWRWSQGARRFHNHLSGGNGTRFGLFSLLYGIHGSYWSLMYEEHCPPVLIRALEQLGYDLRVLSSASMSFPEFRSTAWVTIEDRVEDRSELPTKQERDSYLAERFDGWLGERQQRGAREPFFLFALLDSPHQTYSVAPDLTPFVPYVASVDYLALSASPSPDAILQVKNRYLNAVAHADRVVGRMLDTLERRGLSRDTLVIVTGDHGEEFYEHGFFGHTSNFTAVQTHVTFVLGGPGVEPGDEERPTSHIDVVPTLLEALGADPSQRASYSTGFNLLSPPSERLRVIASWQELGLWAREGILWVPLEGHKGFIEGYDYDWKPLPDDGPLRRSQAAALVKLAEECRRFLR
jgi:uncharacterized protein